MVMSNPSLLIQQLPRQPSEGVGTTISTATTCSTDKQLGQITLPAVVSTKTTPTPTSSASSPAAGVLTMESASPQQPLGTTSRVADDPRSRRRQASPDTTATTTQQQPPMRKEKEETSMTDRRRNGEWQKASAGLRHQLSNNRNNNGSNFPKSTTAGKDRAGSRTNRSRDRSFTASKGEMNRSRRAAPVVKRLSSAGVGGASWENGAENDRGSSHAKEKVDRSDGERRMGEITSVFFERLNLLREARARLRRHEGSLGKVGDGGADVTAAKAVRCLVPAGLLACMVVLAVSSINTVRLLSGSSPALVAILVSYAATFIWWDPGAGSLWLSLLMVASRLARGDGVDEAVGGTIKRWLSFTVSTAMLAGLCLYCEARSKGASDFGEVESAQSSNGNERGRLSFKNGRKTLLADVMTKKELVWRLVCAMTVSPLFLALELLFECGFCPWLVGSSPSAHQGTLSTEQSSSLSCYASTSGRLTNRDSWRAGKSATKADCRGDAAGAWAGRGLFGRVRVRRRVGQVDASEFWDLPLAQQATE